MQKRPLGRSGIEIAPFMYRSEADLGKSLRGGMVKGMLNPRGLRILKALDEVSARYRVSPAQIAIAWLLARPSITAPVASATNVEQLQDIMAAVDVRLDPEALQALDAASAP